MSKIRNEQLSRFITDEDAKRARRITELILDTQGIEGPKKEALLNLIDRYKLHMGHAYKAQISYRRLAHFLAIITPSLGAIVTAISVIQVQSPVLAALGVLVTITSAIDSTYKASHGFEKCADILIKLNDWFVDFEVSLIEAIDKDDKTLQNSFANFTRRKNEEMSVIGREYTSVAVPFISGFSKDSFPHPHLRGK
jgi:hypothetical protein